MIVHNIYKNYLIDHVTSAEVGGWQGWITGGIGKKLSLWKQKTNWMGSLQSTDLSMTKTLMTLKNLSLEFNAFRQHSCKVASNLKNEIFWCWLPVDNYEECVSLNVTEYGVVEMKASY